MQSQLVFQEKNEIERLRVQNELLACYVERRNDCEGERGKIR